MTVVFASFRLPCPKPEVKAYRIRLDLNVTTRNRRKSLNSLPQIHPEVANGVGAELDTAVRDCNSHSLWG